MTKVYLLRHGETEWNTQRRMQGWEDVTLNESGKKQARQCGLFLKDYEINVVVTSPLKRAKETAEIISKIININSIFEMKTFIERNFGLASGLTRQEAKEKFPDGNILNMEDIDTLTLRAMEGLDILKEQFKNQNILLVTHGALINSILFSISNGELGVTKHGNASISIINFYQGKWEIEIYNLSCLLQDI